MCSVAAQGLWGGLPVCMRCAQGRRVRTTLVCTSSLFSVCLCTLYLVHNECSVSRRAGGFMTMISFPSFPDIESETQNFEILSKSREPNSGGS